MGAKFKEAAKSEAGPSPSNQDEEESEGTKEMETEDKTGESKAGLKLSV